ncbi:MAG TPA: hypothetical protein VIH91_03945 [Terriglobales bacterium]
MSSFLGSPKLVKAGFVVLDPANTVLRILAFQYNPETLVRRLDSVSTTSPPPPGVPPAPREIVTFTLALDAADKLQAGDAVAQQSGLLPAISALELLLYPAGNTLTVWVSGGRRVVPVRITEMQIVEQAFDPALNPIRAEVAVTLLVLKDADLAKDSHGRALWDAHFATLQQLAKTGYDGGTLATLGLTGI